MEQIEIEAERREQTGSRVSRRLRREGRLPVNLYGTGESIALHLDQRAFADALRTHARVLSLKIGGKAEAAVIREVQHDPLSEGLVHADLVRIDLSKKIEVGVSLIFKGPCAGEKSGGVMVTHHTEIKVRCLPVAIPGEIELDVRAMEVHDSIHAGEIALPDGVEHAAELELLIVSVSEPRYASGEAETTEEEGAAEPEVIGKAKETKDEEGGPAGES